MLNTERITQLADFIEQLAPHRFGMKDWSESPVFKAEPKPRNETVKHNCGTVACIGGWAEMVFNPDDGDYWNGRGASSLLGLDCEQGRALFTPWGYNHRHDFYTQERAVRTLRRLAETGEVQWDD